MEILLLPNLDLSDQGLISYHDDRLLTENSRVHFRQGDLDGACGPYALMIALVCFGALSRKMAQEIWTGNIDNRSRLAKSTRELHLLIRDGTSSKQLVSVFESIKKYPPARRSAGHARLNDLLLVEESGKPKYLFSTIEATIGLGYPAILSLDWGDRSGHWVVAVGIQTYTKRNTDKSESSHVEKILVIDPSEPMSNTSAWNGVLDVIPNRGRTPYDFWSGEDPSVSCSVDQVLKFSERK